MCDAGSSPAAIWKPLLAGDQAEAALKAARDVSRRLRSTQLVEAAAAAARAQSAFPAATHWIPYSVSQGYAGLAVLWGYLDSCFGDEGWDVSGREQLELAVRGAEASPELHLGLFSGLSGLAFGALQLFTGTRVVAAGCLGGLDEADLRSSDQPREQLRATLIEASVSDFDVISGASGVGAYLLCRRDQPGPASALAAVVQALDSTSPSNRVGSLAGRRRFISSGMRK